MISPSIEFVSSLGFGLALYLGVQNGMNEGEFFSLFLALYFAYDPIKRLGQMHGMIRQLEAPLIRVDRILNLKESVQNTSNPKSISVATRDRSTSQTRMVHAASRRLVLCNA